MRRPCVPFSAVLFLVLTAALAPPAFAQTQGETTAPAVPRAYDASREVILHGTIAEVLSRPATGLPLGLHLMLVTAQGNVDVHLGPYLGRTATEKGLVAGATVQVTGVTTHFAGGDSFLARLVIVGNQTITVRNENGMPVRPTPAVVRAPRGTGGL
jgi:hypothetical protein